MIDAWDVYWVMQLDSLGDALVLLSVIGTLLMLATLVVGAFNHFISSEYPELASSQREAANAKACFRLAFRMGILIAPVFLAAAFLPSSRTAAAMIVLPAITSDSVVQTVAPEARELYELAKDALRSVAKDKAVEPKPAE